MGLATDLWGDVPFTDAGSPFPTFDSQADVYTHIQALLDSAITNLGGAGGGNAVDFYFGNDFDKWIATAHTLKARYYMHTAENGDLSVRQHEAQQCVVRDGTGHFGHRRRLRDGATRRRRSSRTCSSSSSSARVPAMSSRLRCTSIWRSSSTTMSCSRSCTTRTAPARSRLARRRVRRQQRVHVRDSGRLPAADRLVCRESPAVCRGALLVSCSQVRLSQTHPRAAGVRGNRGGCTGRSRRHQWIADRNTGREVRSSLPESRGVLRLPPDLRSEHSAAGEPYGRLPSTCPHGFLTASPSRPRIPPILLLIRVPTARGRSIRRILPASRAVARKTVPEFSDRNLPPVRSNETGQAALHFRLLHIDHSSLQEPCS